jgi:hypothetical protein
VYGTVAVMTFWFRVTAAPLVRIGPVANDVPVLVAFGLTSTWGYRIVPSVVTVATSEVVAA